jgi:S1-C subfamily serine protease
MQWSDIIEKVRPSIAVVFALDSAGNPIGHGTGFVFGQADILVTCNHVLSTEGDSVIKFANEDKLTPATVAIRDIEHDIALLKFSSESPKKPLKLCSEADINEGMNVCMPGYPLEYINFLTHQGIISGIVKDATATTTYVIDGTINPGNSGGPLIDSAGNVCGVVNAKRREYNKLIEKIEDQSTGALSLHGIDLIESLKALARNTQLGMGYAIPASYIPQYTKPTKPKGSTNA